jgi:copper chaperone CopZ
MEDSLMWSKTFKVADICCPNCARLVRYQLGLLDGVNQVDVNVRTKIVTVQWATPATWQQIGTRLEESGYPPGPELHEHAELSQPR